MSGRLQDQGAPHPAASLFVPVAAGAAAVAAGALGPAGLALIATGAALAFARARGVRPAVAVARPMLATLVAALYVPVFLVDFALTAGDDPVLPLARLVALLCFIEGVAGSRRAPFRPLLLGLLLVIVSAAETTDAWFGAGLAVFGTAAVVALSRITAHAASGDDSRGRPEMPLHRALLIATASLTLGALLFLVVPHSGAGWGRRPLLSEQQAGPATGLSDEVRLGTIGLIKKRRSIAFRARVQSGAPLDETETYWRGQVFESFTGRGWRAAEVKDARPLRLPAGRRVRLAGGSDGSADTILDLRIERAGLDEILVPGPPAWIEPGERSTIVLDDEGLPRSYLGAGPRRYRLGLTTTSAGPTGPEGGASEPDPLAPSAEPVAAGRAELDAVNAWVRDIAPGEDDPQLLARALVRDLSSRSYSLDTGAIDPGRPLASFLAGAPAHCEYFATAMVLGLRARGVPARAIGGYLGAERLPFSREMIVRDERAHLWVEAWMPGRGWTTFDPTPPAGRRGTSGALATLRGALDWSLVLWDSWIVGLDLDDQQNLALSLGAAISDTAGRLVERLRTSVESTSLLILAVGALTAGLVLRRRVRRRGTRTRLPSEYARLLRLAARRGLTPRPAETAAEFCRRAGPLLGDREVVSRVTRLYERERFGGCVPSEQELRIARGELSRLGRAPRTTRGARVAAGGR